MKIINSYNYHTNVLFRMNINCYVSMKRMEQIKKQNQQKGHFKILTKISGYFLSQCWNDFKKDFSIFKQIKKIPYENRTLQTRYLYRRIRADLIKFGPAFCVFNVPFGFPLFYMYLKLFPKLVPSWMMVDTLYQKIQKQKYQIKKQSLEYYIQNYNDQVRLSFLKQAIYKQTQSLADLRRISLICYGDYIDGTEYLSQKLNIQFPNGLISSKISIFILKQFLKNQLEQDYELESKLKQIEKFQDKLFYKLLTQIQKLNKQIN